MTVAELIKVLTYYPQNSEVLITYEGSTYNLNFDNIYFAPRIRNCSESQDSTPRETCIFKVFLDGDENFYKLNCSVSYDINGNKL